MPIRMPTRRQIFVPLLLLLAVTAVSYGWLFNSEPYRFARDFVARDARVLQATGTHQSSRLSLLFARVTFGERRGEGELTFVVKAERGDFDVIVGLEKRDGRWAVVRAQAVPAHGATVDIVGKRDCEPCRP